MKPFLKLFTGGVLVAGFCVLVAGCSQNVVDTQGEVPTPVQVSFPVEREVTDYSDHTGRTVAVDSVEVRARVSGYLDKVNFKEGALVKAGDVLFEIDRRPYQAQYDQAQSQLRLQEASLQLARTTHARNVAAGNAVSLQELDQSKATLDEAEARVKATQASLENFRLNLDFTRVTSPINGRVSRYYVTRGNLVTQDQTLLTTVVSVDPMYAYFDVDERTVLRVRELIREGKLQSARDVTWQVFLGLGNEEGYPRQGTIDFVDNQVNPKVGTLRLRGVFPNKDEALAPGYFVRVRVPIGHPHKALLVDERAIDVDQGQKIVYVVGSDNKIAIRPIRLGGLHDGARAILDGLTASDRVIVTGLQQVRPGMIVEPSVVDMPVANSKTQSPKPKQIVTTQTPNP